MSETMHSATGTDSRSAVRRMGGLEFLRGLMDGTLPAPPFSPTTRIRPLEIEEGRVVFAGQPHADFYNPMGMVHGGWIATLLGKVYDKSGNLIAHGSETCVVMRPGRGA